MARRAYSLQTLLDQVDALAPNRSKASDGWISDAAHQATKSDHNPLPNGVVLAQDITHDPEHGLDCNALAEALRTSRDARISYVIFNGRTFDPGHGYGWEWRPYTGANKHDKHLHISVRGDYDNKSPWAIGGSMYEGKTAKGWHDMWKADVDRLNKERQDFANDLAVARKETAQNFGIAEVLREALENICKAAGVPITGDALGDAAKVITVLQTGSNGELSKALQLIGKVMKG